MMMSGEFVLIGLPLHTNLSFFGVSEIRTDCYWCVRYDPGCRFIRGRHWHSDIRPIKQCSTHQLGTMADEDQQRSDEDRIIESLVLEGRQRLYEDLDFLPTRQSLYQSEKQIPEYDDEVFQSVL